MRPTRDLPRPARQTGQGPPPSGRGGEFQKGQSHRHKSGERQGSCRPDVSNGERGGPSPFPGSMGGRGQQKVKPGLPSSVGHLSPWLSMSPGWPSLAETLFAVQHQQARECAQLVFKGHSDLAQIWLFPTKIVQMLCTEIHEIQPMQY